MNPRAQIRLLPDGRRLHLHDGPIDLIVEAFGDVHEVEAAYRAACARFMTVLNELCSELSFLRQACSPEKAWPRGAVARRMTAAVLPYATECFITPMAAVAGAVAEEILAAMVNAADLSRAYVNDGGDIAWHLTAGERFTVGMVDRPDRPSLFGTTTLQFADPVRGIATSGWRGRSFSLGIADAVTVLADSRCRRRCRGYHHRQRGRSARTSRHPAHSGLRSCSRYRSRLPSGYASGWNTDHD